MADAEDWQRKRLAEVKANIEAARDLHRRMVAVAEARQAKQRRGGRDRAGRDGSGGAGA
jgi:hypothetical protein